MNYSKIRQLYVGIMNTVITVLSPPTARSVIVSWTLPEFSLQVLEYRVVATRVTGSGLALCTPTMDTTSNVTTGSSMAFTGLEEFSTYTVTITATLDAFGATAMAASSKEFTTLTAGMTLWEIVKVLCLICYSQPQLEHRTLCPAPAPPIASW